MIVPIALDIERPLDLLRQCPPYQPTPIKEVTSKTEARILIKDETNRFNLGAFKALGGIYAIAAFLLQRWQEETGNTLTPKRLFDRDIKEWSNRFTFICASAGNHGIAVAKGAQLFNARCRVYLSISVPENFEKRLTNLNAIVIRFGDTYEDSMAAARIDSDSTGPEEILLSDSSWPGYTKMPRLVMEGYTVLAEEMRHSFMDTNAWPTHVFLQAGVGGMAAAVAYHIRSTWIKQPEIIVVEPEAAPCLLESNRAGTPTVVTGPVSAMGRLDCKEPSLLAFQILQQAAVKFVCVSESDAVSAVARLSESGIETTPSGAAGMAAMLVAERLGIMFEENSICLGIASEQSMKGESGKQGPNT